jgi:two-component system phosphate regulon sensor histidine kinase PhoR
MRPTLLLGTIAAIAAVPVAALLLLLATGAASAGPVLAAIAAVLLAALVLAAIWAHDIELLNETLRYAALENSAALSHAAAAPRLPAVERVTRRIERLARTLATRAAQVGQLLRANEAIVESLPDPLLVLGADRSVRRANAAARQAFGADMSAVLRHPVLRAALDRAFADDGPQIADLTLPVPVEREVRATVLVMHPPLADGGHAIVVLSDRTRERAVERMRVDFIANASHELRTPLASLIGFIDTLLGPAADDLPAQRRFLGIMAEQAQRMNRLIDDLLSLSRIELTEHQAPSERVHVDAAAERIAAAFEPRLRARRMRLELELAEALPAITGDTDQLEQVLQNLVDNAVKYGREGGVVGVRLGAAEPGGRWPARPGLVLAVSDDGPGIAKADVPRLTERFYRVDKGRSRSAGGTGLGLAIVKHIVNRHRGQLVIDSVEGKGSTFSVWLPLGTDKPAEPPPRAAAPAPEA